MEYEVSPNEIISTVHKVSQIKYLKALFAGALRGWIYTIISILIIFLALSFYDIRFGIVLLMILFLILPPCIFFLYYYITLRPECFYSFVEKTTIINHQGIWCDYNDERRLVTMWDNIQKTERYEEYFLFYTGQYTYFYLPVDVIEDYNEKIHILESYYKK